MITQLFLGSNSAQVKTTKYAGIRVLSKEEDYGLNLINSQAQDQKSIAMLNRDVPEDILTNPSRC